MKRWCLAAVLTAFFSVCGGDGGRLSTASAATWILVQLGEPPDAVDSHGRTVPGAEKLKVCGRGGNIPIEVLTDARFSQAFVWEYQHALRADLERLDVEVIALKPVRLAECPALIRRIGAAVGRREAAEVLAAKFVSELNEPDGRPGVPVYFELYSPYRTVGRASYIGDLLAPAGGLNVGGALTRAGVISPESVVAAKPEVIFYVEGFTSADEIARRPGFRRIPAVRNRRIYPVPRRMIIEGVEPAAAIAFFKQKLEQK